MNRTAALILTVSLVASSASANALDMVRLAPGLDGAEQVRLRLSSESPLTVDQISAALRAQGKADASPEAVGRMMGSADRSVLPCSDRAADCRELTFDYAPASAPTMSKAYQSGGSVTKKFGGLLMGILSILLSVLAGGAISPANAAIPPGGGYAGTSGGYTGYTGANASTAFPGGANIGSLLGLDGLGTRANPPVVPGANLGGTPGATPSPGNGRSFFANLPLPQGSWDVGPNGHFWDCRSTKCGRPHHGNDLHAAAGTPVFSVADGVVQRVKDQGSSGYHQYLIIRHEGARSSTGQNYNTLYGHIEYDTNLREGQTVRAGQQIGTVSANHVRSPHLHFEVLVNDGTWKGQPVNPDAFADFHPDGETGQVVYNRVAPPLGRGLV